MRRANKILMATVAILLCLVLITTSVVSGVFAKFAISKSAETTVTLEKFGVKVTVTPDSRLVSKTKTNVGDSVTIEYNQIQLVPGSDFSKALNIKFEGKPTVDVTAQVIFYIYYQKSSENTYTATYTKVPAGIGNAAENTYFMPFGFTFGARRATDGKYENTFVLDPWTEKMPQNTIESTIADNIYKRFYFADGKIVVPNGSSGTRNDYRIYKNFNAGETIQLYPRDSSGNRVISYPMNDFDVGFAWPLDWPPEGVENTTGYDYDEICTYYAQNSESIEQITILYTISITQI